MVLHPAHGVMPLRLGAGPWCWPAATGCCQLASCCLDALQLLQVLQHLQSKRGESRSETTAGLQYRKQEIVAFCMPAGSASPLPATLGLTCGIVRVWRITSTAHLHPPPSCGK